MAFPESSVGIGFGAAVHVSPGVFSQGMDGSTLLVVFAEFFHQEGFQRDPLYLLRSFAFGHEVPMCPSMVKA